MDTNTLTLSVDIGGTGIETLVLDAAGKGGHGRGPAAFRQRPPARQLEPLGTVREDYSPKGTAWD